MKRLMMIVVTTVVLLALVGPVGASGAAAVAQDKPQKGHGRYVMVLFDPGTPIPGAGPNEKIGPVPVPDVEKLGGKVLHTAGQRRVIELPVAAAKSLRQHASVVQLHRLWMGEPLEELKEEPYTSGATLEAGNDADTGLSWGPRNYKYDGSGNITQAGPDNYAYDSAGRLISATVGGKTQTYKYDSFGNLIEQSVSGSAPVAIRVDESSNRLVDAVYDAAGNVTTRKGRDGTYAYDALNMLTLAPNGRQMIYDANDERIGVIISHADSRWTIRDLQGRAIREFRGYDDWDPFSGHWTWEQDYVYGESKLIGGDRAQFKLRSNPDQWYGGLRHYHLDHLGSVRLSTTSSGKSSGEHDYLPFGASTTKAYQEPLGPTASIDTMRWAGHQRDFLGYLNVENTDYLDYMHARYYDPNLGRFLSVDPYLDLQKATRNPQNWNRYSYVRNNPVNFIDPDGRDDVNIGPDFEVRGAPNPEKDKEFFDKVGQLVVGGVAWGIANVVLDPGPEMGDGEVLTRRTNRESAKRLADRAAAAEKKIGIHGVSASAAPPEPGDAARARRADVEKVFKVHNTPTKADPLHRTVELPKPVTNKVARVFNELFRFFF